MQSASETSTTARKTEARPSAREAISTISCATKNLVLRAYAVVLKSTVPVFKLAKEPATTPTNLLVRESNAGTAVSPAPFKGPNLTPGCLKPATSNSLTEPQSTTAPPPLQNPPYCKSSPANSATPSTTTSLRFSTSNPTLATPTAAAPTCPSLTYSATAARALCACARRTPCWFPSASTTPGYSWLTASSL